MEKDEQKALFDWCEIQKCKYHELSLLFHIPNGGSRNVIEAVHLKEQGVKPGVPDIFLPVPSQGKHGLFIEMKYGKNKTSKLQEDWLYVLHNQGYEVAVCHTWIEAKNLILNYLNGGAEN